ncbi:MAG: type II secretion system protein GspL [Gammaproteobacteria bacterium]|nr:type II secretion system protein GspL [Gammaproteobacteria bacterium]
MANRWILYLPETRSQGAEWGLFSEEGVVVDTLKKGDLTQAAQDIRDTPFIVMVPGRFITLLTEMVPARQREKVIQVIPYAMEEQVADDVENLHFALGEKTQEGSYLIAVVAHALMEEWLNRLRESGLQPLSMVPETLALPYEKGTWTVAVHKGGAYCLVRTGDSNAFAVDNANLLTCLKLELSTLEVNKRPEKILLFGGNPEIHSQLASGLAPIELQSLGEPEMLLPLLAEKLPQKPFVNLIQQRYEKKVSVKDWVGYLTPLAAVVGMGLILMAGYKVFHYRHLAVQNEHLYTQIVGLYAAAFPEEHNIVNPKTQMNTHLTRLRGTSQKTRFLQLLGLASSRLHTESNVRLLGVRYTRSKTDLELELETQDYQNFEHVRQSLATILDVEIRTSNIAENNIVQGSLRVTRKGMSKKEKVKS